MESVDAEVYATSIAQVVVVVLAPQGSIVHTAIGTFLVLARRIAASVAIVGAPIASAGKQLGPIIANHLLAFVVTFCCEMHIVLLVTLSHKLVVRLHFHAVSDILSTNQPSPRLVCITLNNIFSFEENEAFLTEKSVNIVLIVTISSAISLATTSTLSRCPT